MNEADFKAEVSLPKSAAARIATQDPADVASLQKYGKLDTIRMDAYEYRPDTRTVCVYDVKTENAHLWFPRMLEFAQSSRKLFGDHVDRIIVAEVKPSLR
jgi:hypothetical protein